MPTHNHPMVSKSDVAGLNAQYAPWRIEKAVERGYSFSSESAPHATVTTQAHNVDTGEVIYSCEGWTQAARGLALNAILERRALDLAYAENDIDAIETMRPAPLTIETVQETTHAEIASALDSAMGDNGAMLELEPVARFIKERAYAYPVAVLELADALVFDCIELRRARMSIEPIPAGARVRVTNYRPAHNAAPVEPFYGRLVRMMPSGTALVDHETQRDGAGNAIRLYVSNGTVERAHECEHCGQSLAWHCDGQACQPAPIETVAPDGTVTDALGNFAGIDQPAGARTFATLAGDDSAGTEEHNRRAPATRVVDADRLAQIERLVTAARDEVRSNPGAAVGKLSAALGNFALLD